MTIVKEGLIENALRIEEYLNEVNIENRARISSDLLSILRSFCESSMYLIYDLENQQNLYKTNDNLKIVRKYIKIHYKNIYDFHVQLDAGPGHNYVSQKNSESLVLSYIPYLIELRNLLKDICSISVLKSIENYPIDLDTSLTSFYKEILSAIFSAQQDNTQLSRNLYFVRKKSFKMINNQGFYEYVMDTSDDKNNKFNTFVAYSFQDIKYTYDLKFKLSRKTINYLDTNIIINVINDYEYSIRPCCFNNILKLISYQKKFPERNKEYKRLMTYLKEKKSSLYDVITENEYYLPISNDYYIEFINICKSFLLKNSFGSNLIKYLLMIMRNDAIKAQQSYRGEKNIKFNNLCIQTGSLAFELMPYAFNPKEIKTTRKILNSIIDNKVDYQDEIFYSAIVNAMNNDNILFVKAEDIGYSESDAIELAEKFNVKLKSINPYYLDYKIIYKYNHFTIEFYLKETIEILSYVEQQHKSNIRLNKLVDTNLSDIQRNVINSLFSSSNINFIYGEAGTGKTSVIKEIIKNNSNINILCLTTTNTALNNIKVECKNATYANISEFINSRSLDLFNFELIIVDEASFVSTNYVYKIIKRYYYTSLLLIVGDTEQIESIEFGNWFKLCVKKYKDSDFMFELEESFRCNSDGLKKIFKNVRNDKCNKLLELLDAFKMSSKLTKDVFSIEEDAVVLCLNYDGLYGINNVNRYLQAKNNNKGIIYQQNIYKEGDPIVFIDNNFRYFGIYNNLKGIIKNIFETDGEILFSVYTDSNIRYVGKINNEITIKRIDNGTLINVTKQKNYFYMDETDIDLKTKLPFQVSYAMSIHKAQGLEFNKVKIIITKESDEQITKNIFYTAITRAKQQLMIYWEPEVANELAQNLKNEINNCEKDLELLHQIDEKSK